MSEVIASAKNVGIALNYDRAERLVFERLGAPAALFLEDDLVLAQAYLRLMRRLIDYALGEPAVGMISGYGRSPTTRIARLRRRTHVPG